MIVKNYFAEYMPFDFGKLVQQYAEIHNLPAYWDLRYFEFVHPMYSESSLTLHKFQLYCPETSPLIDFVELLSRYFIFSPGGIKLSGRFVLRKVYPKG